MGGYMLYCEGALFGGVYDDRLLLKDIPAVRETFTVEHIPYPGAKAMLLIDSEDPALIASVVDAMKPQLPKPRARSLASNDAMSLPYYCRRSS